MTELKEHVIPSTSLGPHQPRAPEDAAHTLTLSNGMTVEVHGDPQTQPVAVTVHDLGLNHTSCFTNFFNHPAIAQSFAGLCVCHVALPGQQPNAPDLEGRLTMDGLVAGLELVRQALGVQSMVGVGVGLGGYLFMQYAIDHPDAVDALILVSTSPRNSGWFSWAYGLAGSYLLWFHGLDRVVEEQLMQRYFGHKTRTENTDLVQTFQMELRQINSANLWKLIEAYIGRKDISADVCKIKCRSLLLTGDQAYYLQDIVFMLSQLDPSMTEWVKVYDCGNLVTEEEPLQLAQPLALFFAGLQLTIPKK